MASLKPPGLHNKNKENYRKHGMFRYEDDEDGAMQDIDTQRDGKSLVAGGIPVEGCQRKLLTLKKMLMKVHPQKNEHGDGKSTIFDRRFSTSSFVFVFFPASHWLVFWALIKMEYVESFSLCTLTWLSVTNRIS